MKTFLDILFCTQLFLIVFRLVGIIHWPAWLVLMPVWLLFGFGIGVVCWFVWQCLTVGFTE